MVPRWESGDGDALEFLDRCGAGEAGAARASAASATTGVSTATTRRWSSANDPATAAHWRRAALPFTVTALAVASAAALVMHPPMQGVGRGEVGVRINHLTGNVSEWNEGSVFVLPGLQQMRVFSLRDHS